MGRPQSAQRHQGGQGSHGGRNAVRTGKLIKPQHCEVCGCKCTARQLQGHHVDYDFPMIVIWCCAGCHAILDGRAVNPDLKLVKRAAQLIERRRAKTYH
jgi:ribosomal protein L37AE/L43A